MKKVAVIHTSFVSVNDLKRLFGELVPEVEMINIVDDSLLPEVIAAGGLTAGVIRRVCCYALQAEAMGADLVFNQCSSVGEAADVAGRLLRIPYLKVDEAMAEEAVLTGGKISVIATLPTTLGPSTGLVRRTAERLDKKADVRPCLCEGAFDVLVKEGDKEKHNRMVLEKIEEEAESADVIVLAQGSMITLLPYLEKVKVPVLTSPRSGVMRIRRVLNLEKGG